MIEGVPGDAPGRIPGGPPPARQRRSVRRLPQDLEHRGAFGLDSGAVVERRRREFEADLLGVRVVRIDHMADHLVAVATATSRALAELGWRPATTRSNTTHAASTRLASRVA